MSATLLINHIEVGKIEEDIASGILIPFLKTFIEEEGYHMLMAEYKYDFEKDSIGVTYVLTEFDSYGHQTTTSYEFDSTKEFSTEDWKEFYQLNEIK